MRSVLDEAYVFVRDVFKIPGFVVLNLMEVTLHLNVRRVSVVEEDRKTAVRIQHTCSVASAWERGVKDIDVIVRFYHPLVYNLSKIESEKTPTISLRGSLSVS